MDQPVISEDEKYGLVPAARSSSRAMRLTAIVSLIALAALAWSVHARHRAAAALSQQTESDEVLAVATARPQPNGSTTELVLPGNLQANYEAPIYARTSGYLRRWYVDIGATVHKGQILGDIEAPEVDQQLRQAEANLAVAQANRKIADLTAERWRRLRATDSVSRQEADQKVSAAQASDAQVQAARANVSRLRELSGFERVVAPYDGVITARDTDIGQLINAGSGSGAALFRIADVSRLRLYVRVPQEDAADMKQGLTAKLHMPDRPGITYEASVAATTHAIDPTTRTLMVELLVDNTKGELLPGAYAEVHFQLPPSDTGHSFLLPANVLLFRGDGLHVATVDAQGHVALKQVTIGRDYGGKVEIVSGLSGNDHVILSPPDSLVDGTVVRVVKQGGPEA
ncbi:MAG TPA: efflux RND transporter periplasmic adaptor subunit [Steroidobacteraceae bacterium]|jgi:RND family efflux transporter MFP subunit|nr:efflux RND transporter periplasmic adaptor subunit [Steroidobacteraceae bacterium]